MKGEIPTRESNPLSTLASLFIPKGGTTTTNSGGVTETNTSEVSQEAMQALVSQMLSNPNNGLASVSSGQRQSGIYNSTTNQLLTNDLMARVAGQGALLNKKETRTTNDSRGTTVKNSAPVKPGVGAAGLSILQLLPKSAKDKLTESILGRGASSAQASAVSNAAANSGNSIGANEYSYGGPSMGVFGQQGADLDFLTSIDSGLSTTGADYVDLNFGGDEVDLSFLDNLGSSSDLSGADLDASFWEDILFADGGEVKSEKTSSKDKAKEAASVFGGMLQKAVKDLLETQKKRESQVDKYADGGLVNTGTYGNRGAAEPGNVVNSDVISSAPVSNTLLVSALQRSANSLSPSRSTVTNSYESSGDATIADNPNAGTGSTLGQGMSAGGRAAVTTSAGILGGLAGVPGLGTLAGLATAQNNNQALGVVGRSALNMALGPKAMLAMLVYNVIADRIESAPTDMEASMSRESLNELGAVSTDVGYGNDTPSGQTTSSMGGYSSTGTEFANGGEIKGKGTGTSDSILAKVSGSGRIIRVSDGEYILPNDIVDMIGVDALDQLVATFHTPVNRTMRK